MHLWAFLIVHQKWVQICKRIRAIILICKLVSLLNATYIALLALVFTCTLTRHLKADQANARSSWEGAKQNQFWLETDPEKERLRSSFYSRPYSANSTTRSGSAHRSHLNRPPSDKIPAISKEINQLKKIYLYRTPYSFPSPSWQSWKDGWCCSTGQVRKLHPLQVGRGRGGKPAPAVLQVHCVAVLQQVLPSGALEACA